MSGQSDLYRHSYGLTVIAAVVAYAALAGCGGGATSTAPTPQGNTKVFTPYCGTSQQVTLVDDVSKVPFPDFGFENSLSQLPTPQFEGLATLHYSAWVDEMSAHVYEKILAPEDRATWESSVGSLADFQAYYRRWLSIAPGLLLGDFTSGVPAGDTAAATRFLVMAGAFWTPCGLQNLPPFGGEFLAGTVLGLSGPPDYLFGLQRIFYGVQGNALRMALQPVDPQGNVFFSIQNIGGIPTVVGRGTSFPTGPVAAVPQVRIPLLFARRYLTDASL